MDWFLRAFWDLSTMRSYSMGCGPIPWNRIEEYGHRSGFDRSMIQVLHIVVRALDRVYLRWTSNEQQKQRPAPDEEES